MPYPVAAARSHSFSGGLPYTVILPADLSDNGYSSDEGNFYACSPFAQFRFTTEATSLDIYVYGNMAHPKDHINVIVNGASVAVPNPTLEGISTFHIDMVAGIKTVSIVSSLIQVGPWRGTFLVGVQTNAPITKQAGATAKRLLIYGDSIAEGDGSTAPPRDGWAQLVRTARGESKSTMLEAWGARRMYDDCDTAPHRQTFVNRLASYNPTAIWLAIGTNDFGYVASWNAEDFGTAYADLLDKLIATIPGVVIYAQSPTYRDNDNTANSFGDDLPDYRAAIATACAGKTGVTYVNGFDILVTGDLDDGVHPSTAGHAKYAAYVNDVLSAQVDIQPDASTGKDAYLIDSVYAGYNTGANVVITFGKGDGYTQRCLLQFDLSSIPAGATIVSAELALYATAKFVVQDDTYGIYRMLQAWTEGTKSFNAPADGASWNTYDGASGWQTAGASGANDVETPNIGTLLLPAAGAVNEWKIWTLDPAKVQEWLDGILTNNGLMIRSTEAVTKNYWSFASSDNATAGNRPKLTIVYAT